MKFWLHNLSNLRFIDIALKVDLNFSKNSASHLKPLITLVQPRVSVPHFSWGSKNPRKGGNQSQGVINITKLASEFRTLNS